MRAIEKMNALTLKVLHGRIELLRPGIALETVYRWRKALIDGQGINDANKRLLIEATAGTAQAIEWIDFLPVEAAA